MADCIALDGLHDTAAGDCAVAMVSALRQDLDLYPGAPGKTYEPTWVLHDPVRNKFFNLGWLEFELLERWARRDPASIAECVRRETTLDATVEDVATLDAFLVRNQLIRIDDCGATWTLYRSALTKKTKLLSLLLHRYLFFFVPLVHPDRFLQTTLHVARPFFSSTFRKLLALVMLLGLYLVMRDWTAFAHTFERFFSFEGLLYFAFALIVSKCLHELGHAYTCKYYGLHVPTMGVAFLVMWPFLYTDTTESWKLASRRQRMAIGIAGMFTELSLAAFATLLWSFLSDGAARNAVFFLATASWVMTLAININPFMRWDGYYLLSDLLGVQNLQPRAFALGRWRLREWLFGFKDPPPEAHGRRMRRILITYAYSTWIYRLVLFLGIALLVYHFFFKALGVILMAAELVWFIGRPIYAELKEWRRRKTALKWNRNTIVSSLLVALAVLLLIVPWEHHITVPGVLKPSEHKTFYAPLPARLEDAHIVPGQIVSKGELLLTLRSLELDFRIQEANNQIRLFRTSLARQGATHLLERRDVVQQELRKALAAYRGYLEQLSQLQVKAPFSGEIVTVTEDLTPGRWLPDSFALATLVNKDTLVVQAYVTEDHLDRIRQDAPARFHPENPRLQPVNVRVTEIDRASTKSLPEPVLASHYGGPLTTRDTASGALVPTQAVYRIRLAVINPREDLKMTMLRGAVRIKAESESWLRRIWRTVGAVLIRESGF